MTLDEAKAEIQKSIDDETARVNHFTVDGPEWCASYNVRAGLREALAVLNSVTSL